MPILTLGGTTARRAAPVLAGLALVAAAVALTPAATAANSAVAGPGPVNGKIAFASGRDGISQVYVMDADGHHETRVGTSSSNDIDPALSPDGTRIAFSSDVNGQRFSYMVFVMGADGSSRTQLTPNQQFPRYNPAFSPDSKKIAFEGLDDAGSPDVLVMNADGSDLKGLTFGAGASQPAFSPDGTKIAFTGVRDGDLEVFVMDADGGNQTPLTKNGAADNNPAFSPDGTKIVFTSDRDGKPQIYVMDADGGNQRRLTTNAATDSEPVFSPDGTKIAFTSDRDGNPEIYVMDADGGNQTRLTTNDASDDSPSWGALVPAAATATQVISDTTPSTAGKPVTFTAAVTSRGTPAVAGSLQFSDNGKSMGAPTPLGDDGTATLTTSALTAGVHTIRAAYLGTDAFEASEGSLTQVVLPVADAGGPYTVAEGAHLTLNGAKSSPGATIGWDLNGDGTFTDATGRTPTLSWADLKALGVEDGPASHPVRARATAGKAPSVTSTPSTIQVTNTAPKAVVTGDLTATVNKSFTVKVGADDPSTADMKGTFTYTVDWGDGSGVQTVTGPADPPVTHTYVATGSFTASFTATDKDGATSGTVTVNVTVTDGTLANTGPDVGPGTIGLAAALLMSGTTLLLLAHGRPRRRKAHIDA